MAIKITKLFPASPDDVEYIEAALNELVTKGASLISVQRRSDGLLWWVVCYEPDVSDVQASA